MPGENGKAVTALGYLGLNVSDAEAWGKLVSNVLGLQVLPREGDSVIDLRMDAYRQRFSLYPGDQDGIAYIGWETAGQAGLDALAATLQEQGIEVSTGSGDLAAERGVAALYTFTDPVLGLAHEIYCDAEAAGEPFKPGREVSGFKTGDQGLGHIVLVANEPDKAIEFFTGVLGFKISDTISWSGLAATFMHCNPRHHTLAVMNEFADFRNGDLNHFMVEANSLDDVGYGYDIAVDTDVPILFTLGKHTNDHMKSFYMITPSGFAIEYGWGGRAIGEDWEIAHYDSPKLWGHRPPG